MTKTKNTVTSLRKSDSASRSDFYKVDVKSIKVDWDSNPRQDYVEEDFQELKESIRENGIKQPISVYVDKMDGTIHLAHGFRRMKATLQLIEEGVEIEKVPCIEVPNNSEQILFDHITLNSGCKLSQVETAYALHKLYIMMGGEGSVPQIAKRTGMAIQKVYNLINFHKEASHMTKDLVKSRKLSMTVAQQIVKQVPGTERQNQTLDRALAKMKEDESKRILPSHLPEIKLQHKVNTNALLKEVVTKLAMEDIQTIEVKDLFEMVKLLETGSPSADDLYNTIVSKELS